MRVASARGKACTHAGAQSLQALVGLEHDLARHHPDELILLAVSMPCRGLAAWNNASQVCAEVLQADMVAEPPVPARAVGLAELGRIAGGIAFGDVGRIEGGQAGLGHASSLTPPPEARERSCLMPA